MSGIFDQVINYAPPSLLKGTVTYKGTWSAATNTPTLINPPDSTNNGFYYVVSAAGTQFSLSFNIGDWIISNGSAWQKVDNTDSVDSVFGRTGAVVGVSTDYSSVGITATAVGASSPSTGAFTTLSATTPLAATSGGTGLSSLGTGVATFLGTPTSANLAAAVTNETGSGSLVFGTSPTITTPVIAQINDANGNETLKLASIASAVNEVTIENAATGNAVHISATGGDASVGLHLAGKGASGYVNVQDSTDATKRIMFNAAGGTTNTRTMLSSTQTVDRTLSLPDATDTLVGKATTDTLTNKTLTSPTITGGALNGTLGATTPSTVAATTLAASDRFTSSTSNTFPIVANGATTGNSGFAIQNTGGSLYSGVESSMGGAIFSGATAYSGVLGTNAATSLHFATNGIVRATVTSTGLNSTAIGATTPSTGAFSTLSANTSFGLSGAGTAGSATFTSTAVAPSASFVLVTGANLTGQIGIGLGKAVSAGNSGFIYWDQSVQKLYLETYAAGKPIVLNGSGTEITGTLSATGQITSTVASGTVTLESTAPYGTGYKAIRLGNNGSTLTVGVESSAGGSLLSSATGYAGIVSSGSTILQLGASNTIVATLSSGAAAITGTLSSSSADVALTTQGNLNISTTDTVATGKGGTIILGGPSNGTYAAIKGVSDSGYYSGALILATKLTSTGIMTEAMRINHSGNVSIGTTSNIAKLNVQCAAAGQSGIFTDATNSTLKIDHSVAGKVKFINGANTEMMSLAGGAVAVTGELSCTSTFTMDGAAAILWSGRGYAQFSSSGIFRLLDSGGSPFGSWASAGIVVNGITMGSGTGTVSATAGVFSVTSDLRAKNPIGKFTKGLAEIVALADHSEIYSFKSDEKNTPRAGWYAQDVEPLIPEAVFHDGADGMASLDERPIVVALVNAVKELSARLAALESK